MIAETVEGYAFSIDGGRTLARDLRAGVHLLLLEHSHLAPVINQEMILRTVFPLLSIVALLGNSPGPQGVPQDDRIRDLGIQLLDEAKSAYEEARVKSSVPAFVDAGFKLEEARIKFIVLQEIGSPENQKLATDRLRAVNQLSKLIHDGKVAVTGSPAEAAAERPSDASPNPSPKPDPTPGSAPTPLKPPVDVTKRLQVPEVAKQREAEKLVREIFKEQYSKKTPSDRQALAKSLLAEAEKSTGDPASLWVLYRDAQDAAIQACDVKLAAIAIEKAAREFDLDTMALKTAAYGAIAKNVKTPGEVAALSASRLDLLDELIAADQYDAADKAATAAVQDAKRANEPTLIARAMTSAKEVAEAKAKFLAMKNALQTLAKTPDDPAANQQMGQFLCFVKGSWDLGLRFILKGSDAALKALAEKELALSPQASDRVAVGDSWFDQAEKEKSPLCKRQLSTHAAAIYESALPDTSGLVRSKIEKRIDTLRGLPPGEDLLRVIDPKRDARNGTWEFQDGILVADGSSTAMLMRLDVPKKLPTEYDLTVFVERKGNAVGDFFVVLTGGGQPFGFSIDGAGGTVSGIYNIDQKLPGEGGNPKLPPGFFKTGVTRTLTYSVRKSSFTVQADGKEVYSWTGDWKRLSVHPGLGVATDKLCVGAFTAVYRIKKLSLQTISK